MGLLLRSFLFLFLLLVPGKILADGAKTSLSIAPKHSIVLKNQTAQPEWMQLWERARVYARAGELGAAAKLYNQLLLEKPNIEEALREYVLVLMDSEQWTTARAMVQGQKRRMSKSERICF